jgi:site-specific recombinase XerD
MGVEPTMDAAGHPSTDLKVLDKAKSLSNQDYLVTRFLTSRRQGLSSQTIRFYKGYLYSARRVVGIGVTPQEIDTFLGRLGCSNGGKHAYYRTLRTFYRWLFSPRSGMGLSPSDNPILLVDPPKVEKKILPAFTPEQVNHLIGQAECVRDKAIISLFADSGLRLSELASIDPRNIDWEQRLIKVWCKGNREGLAVFGSKTEELLREWLSHYNPNGTIWDLNRGGIIDMLRRLKAKTGLPCNPHTFRRTFASVLAKKGIDCLHIMRLGRWESISMVERYTRSVKFEDSLKLYRSLEARSPSMTT